MANFMGKRNRFRAQAAAICCSVVCLFAFRPELALLILALVLLLLGLILLTKKSTVCMDRQG